MTNRLIFAKLNLRETGRVGLKVSIWKSLCELRKEFNLKDRQGYRITGQ